MATQISIGAEVYSWRQRGAEFDLLPNEVLTVRFPNADRDLPPALRDFVNQHRAEIISFLQLEARGLEEEQAFAQTNARRFETLRQRIERGEIDDHSDRPPSGPGNYGEWSREDESWRRWYEGQP